MGIFFKIYLQNGGLPYNNENYRADTVIMHIIHSFI